MNQFVNVVRLLKKEQKGLTQQLQKINAALAAFGQYSGNHRQRPRRLSASGRARIAAAQRARWAKTHEKVAPTRKTKRLSAAARRKIASAQRARWARVRAAKKTA
jgi:hypothetical protein